MVKSRIRLNFLSIFTCLLFEIISASAQQDATLPSWAMGPFIRPENVNPVISPNPESKFVDPMSGKQLAWEANDVFNPAATIKGNRIYVLYRAEDRSGKAIGTRTS